MEKKKNRNNKRLKKNNRKCKQQSEKKDCWSRIIGEINIKQRRKIKKNL